MITPKSLVSPEQVHHYQTEGFFTLERVLPDAVLAELRHECQRFVDEKDAEMDRLGVDVLGLNHRDSRYFVQAYGSSPGIERFLLGDLMAGLASAVLGENVYLFVEQFVVKAPERGMKFSWHQDGGFIGHEHRRYLSCWMPLDDVNEENGTVYLLPYDRAGTREVVPHVLDEVTNDRVGYTGTDPGEPLVLPAGSIACFASTVLHRSGPNLTDHVRRVYLAQYSSEPIYNEDGTALWHLGVPLVVGGVRVMSGEAGSEAPAG